MDSMRIRLKAGSRSNFNVVVKMMLSKSSMLPFDWHGQVVEHFLHVFSWVSNGRHFVYIQSPVSDDM